MGEISLFGYIEKNGHFFGDFEPLFWQLLKHYNKNKNTFPGHFCGQSHNLTIILTFDMFQAPWGPGTKACFESMIDSLIDYNLFGCKVFYLKHQHNVRHINPHCPPSP